VRRGGENVVKKGHGGQKPFLAHQGKEEFGKEGTERLVVVVWKGTGDYKDRSTQPTPHAWEKEKRGKGARGCRSRNRGQQPRVNTNAVSPKGERAKANNVTLANGGTFETGRKGHMEMTPRKFCGGF